MTSQYLSDANAYTDAKNEYLAATESADISNKFSKYNELREKQINEEEGHRYHKNA